MLNIPQIKISHSAKSSNINKYSQPIKDTITLSFKGNIEEDNDYGIENPFSDFFAKMKAKADSKQILERAKDVKKSSILEFRHAKSILDSEEKWISGKHLSNKDITTLPNGKQSYDLYIQGVLKRTTYFTQEGRNVLIEQIDVYNPDGTKDIIIADENNEVKMIRKGVKQIGPKSYLEDAIFAYKKNGIIHFYYENASKVNDGVAKDKSETKHNVLRFEGGQLSYFIPKATYVGNELHYDKKYIFEDGKIKTYMVDVDVLRGEDEPKKRYDF